jgi:hypothetical protein
MKNSLLIALCLIAYFSVAAFGNWQRWKPDTVTGTTTVHDTLVGPTITIKTGNKVYYEESWRFAATVEWGDGHALAVLCYACLQLDYNISPSGCLQAADWDGEYFTFEDDGYANLMFRDEVDDSVDFTVYALDDNGMYDIATKRVCYVLAP